MAGSNLQKLLSNFFFFPGAFRGPLIAKRREKVFTFAPPHETMNRPGKLLVTKKIVKFQTKPHPEFFGAGLNQKI